MMAAIQHNTNVLITFQIELINKKVIYILKTLFNNSVIPTDTITKLLDQYQDFQFSRSIICWNIAKKAMLVCHAVLQSKEYNEKLICQLSNIPICPLFICSFRSNIICTCLFLSITSTYFRIDRFDTI